MLADLQTSEWCDIAKKLAGEAPDNEIETKITDEDRNVQIFAPNRNIFETF